jgi:hypothetical protein
MISVTVSSSRGSNINYTSMSSFIFDNMVSLCVFPSGEVYLWMLQCKNIILLTVGLFDVEKLTTLIPLSLLILYKLSDKVLVWKYLLLTLSLKSPCNIFMWYLVTDWIHALVLCKSYPLYHHLSSVGAYTFRMIPHQHPLSIIYDYKANSPSL